MTSSLYPFLYVPCNYVLCSLAKNKKTVKDNIKHIIKNVRDAEKMA